MCYGISAGSHTIVYAVNYPSGYSVTDAATGWQSAFFILVEEVRLDEQRSCSGNPVSCY